MKSVLFAAIVLITVASASPGSRLVFVGTVTRIQDTGSDLLKPFVVTTTVDRVLGGQFAGKRFQFAVHSPSRAGLQVGKRYTVRADVAGDGYVVDELQWRRR